MASVRSLKLLGSMVSVRVQLAPERQYDCLSETLADPLRSRGWLLFIVNARYDSVDEIVLDRIVVARDKIRANRRKMMRSLVSRVSKSARPWLVGGHGNGPVSDKRPFVAVDGIAPVYSEAETPGC